LTGKELAALLQGLVTALNAKEIPTGAGLIDSFNKEIVNKALQLYGVKAGRCCAAALVDEVALAKVSLLW